MKLSYCTSADCGSSKCASLSGTRTTLLLSGQPLKPHRIHLTLSAAYEGTSCCATYRLTLTVRHGFLAHPPPLGEVTCNFLSLTPVSYQWLNCHRLRLNRGVASVSSFRDCAWIHPRGSIFSFSGRLLGLHHGGASPRKKPPCRRRLISFLSPVLVVCSFPTLSFSPPNPFVTSLWLSRESVHSLQLTEHPFILDNNDN